MSSHHPALILGAGLAGLSTALHAPHAHVIESSPFVGGKARSERVEGAQWGAEGAWTFDVTGHWLHLRDPEMRALVLKHYGEANFVEVERLSRVWSHGVYTRYPFQANTFGLPPQVVKDCVMGAIEAASARPHTLNIEDEPARFDEWVRFFFGEGIAEHFMIPYNAKLWGVDAHEITSRWCQRFVPRPQLEEIVAGAVGCHQEGMGYNAVFLYPREGGIQSVAKALAEGVGAERVQLQSPACSLNPHAKTIEVMPQGGAQEGKQTMSYDKLVSTCHLTTLIDLCGEHVPAEVCEARAKLRATDVTYLNVGVKGALGQPDHWIYVPERAWPMYRVGSFSNAFSSMAPPGHSSLYVELSDRTTPPEQLVPRVVEGLVAMGVIERAEQVLFAEPRYVPEAYVIYDEAYAEARAVVHDWLASVQIMSVGRYGDWNYSSMEDALLDGRRAGAWLSDRVL